MAVKNSLSKLQNTTNNNLVNGTHKKGLKSKFSNVTHLVANVHSIRIRHLGIVQSHATTLTHILKIYLECNIRSCDNKEF
jgi:hypothetical protein